MILIDCMSTHLELSLDSYLYYRYSSITSDCSLFSKYDSQLSSLICVMTIQSCRYESSYSS